MTNKSFFSIVHSLEFNILLDIVAVALGAAIFKMMFMHVTAITPPIGH